MSELLNTDQLNLLARALRQKSFHFIIIGYNHPDVFAALSAWLGEQFPDRPCCELPVSGKTFQEIQNILIQADQDIVLIPDFDWFFIPDNASISVAFNQHRDFFARRKMTLLCFIQSLNFRLLPLTMPDLWSLRSLELEFGNRLGFSPFIPLKAAEPKVVDSNETVGDRQRKESAETILGAMYNLGELDEAEKTMLSVFAALPAEPIAFATLEELLPGTASLDTTLTSLAAKGWINHNSVSKSYKCSPVVQEVTRDQHATRLFDDCKLLIDTLIEKLDYQPGTGHLEHITYETGALYSRYAETLLESIKQKEGRLAILAERVGTFHTTTGNLDQALDYYEQSTQLRKDLYESYPTNVTFKNGLAISYVTLGVFFRDNRRDTTNARVYFQQAETLWAELVASSPAYAEFQRNLTWVKNTLNNLPSHA